jgi:choline dehydrogenase-like flavoprotein
VRNDYDLVIIGTGAGGGTLAYGLRGSGARVLLIERGGYLPQEPANWDPAAVFAGARYKTAEGWLDAQGRAFHPGMHYYVGGNTKMYGAALPRFRREDFAVLEHEGGASPGWPIPYDDLEPYYCHAETVYGVHGVAGLDPTEPSRSQPFPFEAVPHEPAIVDLAARLAAQGLHPYPLPIGVDLRPGGGCIRCKTCDGFPCQVLAKSDADVCCVRPALQDPNIELMTSTFARRLLTDGTGRRVVAAELERGGERVEVRAGAFVVSAGAVNSAALLLRSANSSHPNGLANASGLVGRNYMVHNNTALMAVSLTRRNPTIFQKTLAVNDFYLRGPDSAHPLGNLQLIGKLQAGMLTADQPLVPRPLLAEMAGRSVDWWVMSEDLPDPDNRIALTPDGAGIRVCWRPNNLVAHKQLIKAAREMLRDAGYSVVITRRMGIETNSHQCGTIRFGDDPASSVLDRWCRAHAVENLYVVDSSFFPSSAATNPALTIAAQALRVADHLRGCSS